jgi:hypothetical protein
MTRDLGAVSCKDVNANSLADRTSHTLLIISLYHWHYEQSRRILYPQVITWMKTWASPGDKRGSMTKPT